MVCLLVAPWVHLSVSAGNGWPHNALRHHWLMPISCHFRNCKALLVTSLTYVSGAIASVQTFIFYLYHRYDIDIAKKPISKVPIPISTIFSRYRRYFRDIDPPLACLLSATCLHGAHLRDGHCVSSAEDLCLNVRSACGGTQDYRCRRRAETS